MHIIIAPNAFKGSLSADSAARCIAKGLRQSNLSCKLALFPIADGGDDSVPLLVKRMKGILLPVSVHDPVGRIIIAHFGWVEREREAFIGVSDASGLRLLKKDKRDPLHANTYGTGELIRAALNKNVKRLIVTVGGSATVDGATGLLKALGVLFCDEGGNPIHDLPGGLLRLRSIDTTNLTPCLARCEIIVLCDVVNMLLGKQGAAAVYGPQKGADKKDIEVLERCLDRWNEETKKATNIDMNTLQYGGAGGGVAAGLAAFTNARLVSGIDYFLNEMHFDTLLNNTDIVITGEGSIDGQTLNGKGAFGIAQRAKEKNISVVGFTGQVPVVSGNEIYNYFDELIGINPANAPLEESMRNTARNLTCAAVELGNKLSGNNFP